jgi:hypothetical protein
VACIDDKTKRTVITIYDLRNKFISMTHLLPLGDTSLMVAHDGGVAYVVTSPSFQLIRFREKDTSSKVDILLRKSLYPLAISLAAEEQSDVSEIMKLYKLYGDYLFKKSDFEGAISQYCYTIGYIQPSYVIRRFLDTQKINYLVVYLEQLHLRGISTRDHTTLLLTCYTKTNSEAKLNQFVNLCKPDGYTGIINESIASIPSNVPAFGYTTSKIPTSLKKKNDSSVFPVGTNANKALNVDVLCAVNTLHDAGFDDHAIQLSLMYNFHEEYISICLFSKTKKDADKALAYLVQLVLNEPMDAVVTLLLKFGREFIKRKPEAFSGLLIQLCTGVCYADLLLDSQPVKSASDKAPQNTEMPASLREPIVLKEKLAVEEVIPIFADEDYYLRVFLEGVSRTLKGDNRALSPRIREMLLELYLREYKDLKQRLSDLTETNANDKSTLLDATNLVKLQEDKIMSILDASGSSTSGEYDITQALLLVHSFGFEAGSLFLLDKMQSIDLILRKYIENKDDKGIMKVLRREGRKDTELYIQVLSYFVRLSMVGKESASNGSDDDDEEDDDEERWDHVVEVLSLIDKESVLTPMQVIPILSLNPNLPLHIISRFVKKRLLQTTEELHKLDIEVNTVWNNIQNLSNEEGAIKVMKSDSNNGNKSNIPNSKIQKGGSGFVPMSDDYEDEDELETLQAEAERDTEKKKWRDIKKAQTERTGDHETFFAELEHSVDGFSTIASYFGKTIIS